MGSYYGIGTMKSFFNREGGYLYLIDNESEKMVPREGIEPTTHCLEGSCSIL